VIVVSTVPSALRVRSTVVTPPFGRVTVKQDAIHPNAAGHAALARRAVDELRQVGVVPAD